MIEQLKTHFKFDQFRPGQEEILRSVQANQSLLAILPTGSGKSLCFQFPAKTRPGTVLVISPLIALMQDQVMKASALGISATFLSSTISREDREKRQKRIGEGAYQLIFVTPERFRKPEFVEVIKKNHIQLLAVDEAHCISQWGHDFRPDYSRVGEFRELLGNPPTLALTATATPAVKLDILKKLRIEGAPIIETPMRRENLSLHVHSVYGLDEKIRSLVGLRYQNPGPMLVYVSLIQTLRKIEAGLQKLGLSALIYHGDLSPQERTASLKSFLNDSEPLMIATPAFGLGIDKSNVRSVVHAETPGSLEAYFQEVGRSGRDGLPANCYFLYDADDVSIQMEFLKWSHPEDSYLERIYELIAQRTLVDQQGFDFLREQMSFKNRSDYRPEAAVSILERWGCLRKVPLPFPFEVVRPPTAEDFHLEMGSEQLKTQNQKLLEVVRYAGMEAGCRVQTLETYFGIQDAPVCGKCDLCSLNPA